MSWRTGVAIQRADDLRHRDLADAEIGLADDTQPPTDLVERQQVHGLRDVDLVVHDALGARLLVVTEVDAVADGVRVAAAARVQVATRGAEALAVRAQRLALRRPDERDTHGADLERVLLAVNFTVTGRRSPGMT
jgi:hypothetical protein